MSHKPKKGDGFGHEKPNEGETNDWITPKWVIDAFDSLVHGHRYFDLDPCSSLTQPWTCAERNLTVNDNGMMQPWEGNIWLNPPYGPHTIKWVSRLSEHGNGVSLIFARVETKLWQRFIFPTASAYLFPSRRISFCTPNGVPKNNGGAPSALIAWGEKNAEALFSLARDGKIQGAVFGKPMFVSRSC